MPLKHQPLFNTAYLRSVWAKDFERFNASSEAETLHTRLRNWAARDWQKETASEGAFIQVFFKDTWGYRAAGEGEKEQGYTLQQQYPVKGAGQGGSTGAADIALGYFGRGDNEGIPQALGEFKDDRSGLDKPQKGRPNDRSPVDQCLDYLRQSRTGLISPILPAWGLVTDMQELGFDRFAEVSDARIEAYRKDGRVGQGREGVETGRSSGGDHPDAPARCETDCGEKRWRIEASRQRDASDRGCLFRG